MKRRPVSKLKQVIPKNPTIYWQALPSCSLVNWLTDRFAPQKLRKLCQNRLNKTWTLHQNVWRTFPVTWLKATFRVSTTKDFLKQSTSSFLPYEPPAGSPSRDGDVVVYVKDINQLSLPIPFYSVLVSISVFMTLSTVFHFINFPDNYPLSHSVFVVLILPYWSFELYISLWKFPSALI